MKVEYINWGIAYVDYDGHIEMNKNLKKYPELHDKILEHEEGHMKTPGPIADFRHDLGPPPKGLYTFMMRHPSTWTAIFPFRIKNGRVRVILNQLIFYILWWLLLVTALFLKW